MNRFEEAAKHAASIHHDPKVGNVLVRIELFAEGVLVQAKKERTGKQKLVGWLDIEQARINPLIFTIEELVRELEKHPT